VTDVFEEVEESLRQDKALQVWKKAWPLLLGAALAVVGAVGVIEYMQWQKDQAQQKSGAVFAKGMDALEKKDFAGAKAAFAELGAGKDGFAVLANHALAGVEKELSDDPAAIGADLAAAAAADKGVLSDIAVLKIAYLKADAVDLAELTRIVDPLLKKGGTLGAMSRELLASKKLAGGDVEGARRDFQALALDLDAPQQMKQRVQQTLFTLPKAAAATPAEAPAETAPTPPAGQTQQ
jgi:hypothetical protein